ncbi:serine/threonine-protein kinase [Lipingzhangella halophila]|uniref:non-specific serine/threonine protein kinase n=2 Tax=Lipingzhangella halophila TaxID=1783352 RepID=A0A7W7RF29_9ACTN|nr:serine/threonine-protein kinase [Lipingzhangella halophila]
MTTADPLVGATLDRRYYVESRIAGGGMATVYVGHDLRLDRRLALKVMHASLARDPSFVRRFINEAHSVAKLSHPNVVQVYDQGNDQGHVFLAMEYVPGSTLRDQLSERGRLAPQSALQIMAAVLAALGSAHQAGIAHRDVKPENVLLTRDGRVKVADFGLARAVEDSQQGQTKTGTVMGTAAYLAPEQIEHGASDARSDVYAAGIMLYELLTGSQPHTGENPIAVAYQHVNNDVPRPSSIVPGIPPEVDQLVTKATERDPRYRPANAGQYLAAVLEVLPSSSAPVSAASSAALPAAGGPAPAAPGGNDTIEVDLEQVPLEDEDRGGERPARPWYMGPAALVGGALVLVVLVGLGWWLLIGRYESVPELAGMEEEAAEERLNRLDLELVVAEDRTYSDSAEAGMIAETSPGFDERILPGETVTVTLSKGPQVVDMPDIVGEPVSDAREQLEDAGISEIEEDEKVSHDEPPGTVLSSDPEPGSDADREEAVTLEVSSGFNVPDVVGSEEDQARTQLEDVGLTVEVEQESSEDVDKGEVMSQDPEGGTTVGAGDTVTLTVSSGEEKIEIPDVTGWKVDDAKKELKDLGFKVKVNEGLIGGDRVQSYRPNGEAKEGDEIQLNVGPFAPNGDGNGRGNGDDDDGDGDGDD